MRFWGVVCVLMQFLAGDLFAATATGSLSINAKVNSLAKITLSTNVINFVEFYHEHEDLIPATENPVSISSKAKTGTSSTVTLAFLADDDLRSENQRIAISEASWTATGNGYQNGTMNKSAAQTVGSWTGSGSNSGTLSFFLKNKSNQNTGTYHSSGTFTLSAP